MMANLLNFGINSSDYFTANKENVIKAANQGDVVSQYNLALMYNKGVGVPQDDAEALKWYLKAAEQGHALAQYNLGMVYYFGKSVPQDMVTAYKWVMVAAEYGNNAVAKDALAKVAKKMSPEQIATAEADARSWHEQHSK